MDNLEFLNNFSGMFPDNFEHPKNVTEKFYQSKERLDSEIEWARRESEIKEGPHAVKDWREDTIKSAIIAGASAIDPVYGICAGLVVSISNDELDKDKALEIAGEVYGECDDNLDINKKIKDISKEPLNGMVLCQDLVQIKMRSSAS